MSEQGELRGGQIWKQERFPYMTRYITLTADGGAAMLGDPRQEGSCIVTDASGRWNWNWDGLEERLKSLGYVNQGQLHNLLTKEPA